MDELSIRSAQQQELAAMRAIFLDDWRDLPPVRTAWGTRGEEGWWVVRLKRHEGLVGVGLKGRLTKGYPAEVPSLSIVEPLLVSPEQVRTLTRLVQEFAKTRRGQPMLFEVSAAMRRL